MEQLDANWSYPRIRRGRIALALSFQSPVSPNLRDSAQYMTLSPSEKRERWLRRSIEIANGVLQRSAGSAEALALRGEAQQALVTLGVPNGDSLATAAEKDLRAALNVRPDAAQAWSTLAELALYQGRFSDAAVAARKAFDSDPFFEVRRIVSVAFFSSLTAEDFEDAKRWCQFGLTHYPGDPRFTECELTLVGWTGRSIADAARGRLLISAIEQRDTLHMLTTTWDYRRLMVAAVFARAGLTDSAHSVLESVVAKQKTDSTLQRLSVAEGYVHLLLNNRESALRAIEERVRRAPQERAQLSRLPWFRALHGDPRFEAVLRPR